MSDQPLTRKVGLDPTDFKAGIAEMNRDLRVVESGFRASAAALGDWGKSATGLEMRIKALNSEMEIQQQKVAALKGEYDRIVAAQGADSRAAEELQVKLNKATEELNRMGAELGTSEAALKAMKAGSDQDAQAVDNLGKKTDETSGKMPGFAAAMHGVAAAGKAVGVTLAAIGAAAVGAAIGLGKLVLDSAASADELNDLSLKTGISIERLQELRYAGEQMGTDLEIMTSSMARMVRTMSSAGTNKETAAVFKNLGVAITDSNGQLRDSEAVFGDVIDALGKIPNEAERDAIAMKIFGKSAQELNPLIVGGSDNLARLSDEAHKMGAVMSTESVQAAADLNDQLSGLKLGLQGTVNTLLSAFIPGFSKIATVAGGYMSRLAGIITGAGGNTAQLSKGLGGFAADMARVFASQTPKLLGAGLAILQGIITAIVGALPTLLPAVISILTMLVQFLTANLPLLVSAAVQILTVLIQGLVTALPMLITAAISIILTLIQGITQMLPTLIPTIIQVMLTIVQVLITNLPMLITAAMQLIMALIQGVIAALPLIIQQLPVIVQSIVDVIILNLPLVVSAALQILMALISGIINNLPTLVGAAVRIVNTIMTGIMNLQVTLAGIGKNIVMGIWNGIQEKADWFFEQVKQFFKRLINEVKEALGIASPSQEFAAIGNQTGAGLEKGMTSSLKKAAKKMKEQMNGVGASLNASLAVTGGGPGGIGYSSQTNDNREITTNYGPVTYVTVLSGAAQPEKARAW